MNERMHQRLINSFNGKWNQEREHTHVQAHTQVSTLPGGVCTCRRPRCYWSWLGLTGGDSGLPLTRSPPSFHPPQMIRGSGPLLPARLRETFDWWMGGGCTYCRFGKITSRSHRSARHKLFHAPGLSVPSLTDVHSDPTLPFKQALLPVV